MGVFVIIDCERRRKLIGSVVLESQRLVEICQTFHLITSTFEWGEPSEQVGSTEFRFCGFKEENVLVSILGNTF